MILDQVQAIRDAITLKNQLIVDNETQLREARKSTAIKDAGDRIEAQIQAMESSAHAAIQAPFF